MKKIKALLCILAYLPLPFLISEWSFKGIHLLFGFMLYGVSGYLALIATTRDRCYKWWQTLIMVFIALNYFYVLGQGYWIVIKYSEFVNVYPWYYILFNAVIILGCVLYGARKRYEKNNID